MDGDTQDAPVPEAAVESAPEPVAETRDEVTPAQLIAFLGRATFQPTRGRRGYHQGEVEALLKRLAEAVQAEEPLADLVRKAHLDTVRLEDGFDIAQVDEFLAAVVDLDPHRVVKPEVGRSGLITKLFG